jgi:hypothetical protein
MRKVSLIGTIALTLLLGCGTTTVSRVYPDSMDATWGACVRTVENLTGASPAEANRQAGRIVTKWNHGILLSGAEPAPGLEREADTVRAIITLAPVQSGTKVTVKIEKAAESRERVIPEDPGSEEYGGGVVVYTNSTSWQNTFLDELEVQLEKTRTGKR